MKIYPTSLVKGEVIMIHNLQLLSGQLIQSISNNNNKKGSLLLQASNHISERKNENCSSPSKIIKFQLITRMLTITEHMPLGDLSPGIVTDLLPVLASGSFGRCSQDQPPNHLIAGSPFRIQNQKFDTDLFKTLTGNIKDKQFIEHCIGGAFLHMSLLFGDSLFGMVQVHFDIGICNGKQQTVQ